MDEDDDEFAHLNKDEGLMVLDGNEGDVQDDDEEPQVVSAADLQKELRAAARREVRVAQYAAARVHRSY